MLKLTLDDLKKMDSGTIFAHGAMQDSPLGLSYNDTGNLLTWVAKRGDGFYDWAIYCHWYKPNQDLMEVAKNGDKLHNLDNVQRLVPCTPEALELYRR